MSVKPPRPLALKSPPRLPPSTGAPFVHKRRGRLLCCACRNLTSTLALLSCRCFVPLAPLHALSRVSLLHCPVQSLPFALCETLDVLSAPHTPSCDPGFETSHNSTPTPTSPPFQLTSLSPGFPRPGVAVHFVLQNVRFFPRSSSLRNHPIPHTLFRNLTSRSASRWSDEAQRRANKAPARTVIAIVESYGSRRECCCGQCETSDSLSFLDCSATRQPSISGLDRPNPPRFHSLHSLHQTRLTHCFELQNLHQHA